MQQRLLSKEEYRFAFELVFRGTLPLNHHIVVDDKLGLGDRPWTNWDPDEGTAYLHLGPIARKDLTKGDKDNYWKDFGWYCDILIHELTHVWQYYHGRFVKTNAAVHQLAGWALNTASALEQPIVAPRHDFSDIYDYDVGYPWDSYNVEQQAQIVEDWASFDTEGKKNGKNKAGMAAPYEPRWTYIQKIRLAGEHWDQDMRNDQDRQLVLDNVQPDPF